jgi:hypothetical protein
MIEVHFGRCIFAIALAIALWVLPDRQPKTINLSNGEAYHG